ncbi:SGNH/GDSL hydrolase family protein [Alphaproteobacteria bacterium KMM 3653]|uniref:SGNH/GDSL hydrolase family protein n=1 Tax=Harenicola maris TaxID=2841044 RepID=A0AAP2G2H6_9RHOB|nr:SGNH/GDSL hydrolase family protein [Harenicola maris]
MRVWLALAGLLALAACAPNRAVMRESVMVIGDSILAWNGGLAPEVMGEALGRRVLDRSRSGARVSGAGGYGFVPEIAAQYRGEAVAWVVMDGGGNDLLGECGCDGCDPVLDGLISADGRSGEIARIVERIRAGGARVLLVGYYPVSDRGGPFEECRDELAVLAERMGRLAALREGVSFASLGEVIGASDLEFYGPDRVHPTEAGSRLIGRFLAEQIEADALRAVEDQRRKTRAAQRRIKAANARKIAEARARSAATGVEVRCRYISTGDFGERLLSCR